MRLCSSKLRGSSRWMFRLCTRNMSHCFTAVSMHKHATRRSRSTNVRNAVCMKRKETEQTVDSRRMQSPADRKRAGSKYTALAPKRDRCTASSRQRFLAAVHSSLQRAACGAGYTSTQPAVSRELAAQEATAELPARLTTAKLSVQLAR